MVSRIYFCARSMEKDVHRASAGDGKLKVDGWDVVNHDFLEINIIICGFLRPIMEKLTSNLFFFSF